MVRQEKSKMEVGTEQTGMIKFVFKKGKLVLVMKLGDDGKLIWRGIAKVVNRAKVYVYIGFLEEIVLQIKKREDSFFELKNVFYFA